MNPLKSLETTIASLVEGGFGRLFRTEVRPMELARKLAREMDEHRTASVSRVYAPNEYSVWLSPQDRARYDGVEHEVIDELCGYLLEHARREELILASPPSIASTPTRPWRSANSASRRGWCARPSQREEPVSPPADGSISARPGRTWADDDLQHFGAHQAAARGSPDAPRCSRAARGRRSAPDRPSRRRHDRAQS